MYQGLKLFLQISTNSSINFLNTMDTTQLLIIRLRRSDSMNEKKQKNNRLWKHGAQHNKFSPQTIKKYSQNSP